MLSPGIALILNELNAALGKVPREAAECVRAHDRVFVGGAGRSGLMLRAFAMRLMQTGREVCVIGETVTPSAWLPPPARHAAS